MEQNRSEQPVEAAFGFLTVVDAPSHGLFGGYLLVDLAGRPLEFHCTAPVKVSRAQQILYGATLQSHLHGRQIGAALLAEGTVTPELVLTDLESMLHVRPHTALPVALVTRAGAGTAAGAGAGAGAEVAAGFGERPKFSVRCLPAATSSNAACFAIGDVSISPHTSDAGLEPLLREKLESLLAAVDLSEPFERIRAAIEEAQRH